MSSKITTWMMAGVLCAGLLSCDKKEDEETKTTEATEAPGLTTTTSNITTVSQKMVPGSLVIPTELHLNGDPCQGLSFFACQPNLLKLYLSMGKGMVDNSNAIITQIAPGLAQLPGKKGKITSDDGASVDYDITSATVYRLLISSTTGPFISLDVNGNVYRIQLDSSNSPDEDQGEGDGGGPAKIETQITYTDENTFSVNLLLNGMACKPDDVQAPGAIGIDIQYANGVAQGKAMMYLPRWMGNNSCETEPTADSKAFIYTDFVGDDSNTTAALYLMKNSVSSVDVFPDWEIADFCSNYADQCNNGYAFGMPVKIEDAFKNNFCVTQDDTEWGKTCSSESPLISTPTYSASTLWTVPSQFEAKSITLPTSL